MKLYRILTLTLFALALISCGGAEERKAVYLEKAKVSLDAGAYDKARIELKNVLQIDPKDGDAYFQLGKIYEIQKNYRKAYNNYLKVEELKPELLANHAKLGRFYLLLMNDSEKAGEKIDLILSKEPENSDGLLLKAAIHFRDKNIVEAINITEGIVSRDPNHSESVAFLVSLYMKEKKVNDAIAILDTVLLDNPNNEILNSLLAVALVENKNYERAETIYKEFLERNSNVSASYNNLAKFYGFIENEAKAEETLRASIDNDLDDEDRVLVLIKFLRSTKGNDEAIKELGSFVIANKQHGKLRIGLGELLILNNDKQSAIKVYADAAKDFSEDDTGINARLALASIYISDKSFDKANMIVEEAIMLSPNDPKLNFLRAKLAVHNKDMEKAVISLRIVIKETPENIEAFIILANVYEVEGNAEQARSALISAYDNNKTNTDSLLTLAKYQLSRDAKQAEKIIDDYNSIKENDYEGLSIKATILNQNKQQAEAYKIAKTLRELFSNKPNGYLQSIPYLGVSNDRDTAISILEKGYLSSDDNRKILILLTTLQSAEKQYDVSEKRLVAEISAKPNDTELKVLLSKIYIVQKKFELAEKELNDVLSINLAVEEPYLLLSHIYQSTDQGSVKSILISGRDNVTSSIKIPLRLASFYEEEKNYKEAIDVYRVLNDSHSDNLIIMNNLASMLSEYSDNQDDLILAKSLAEKLKDKEQPVFLDTVGWVYYQLGEYDESVQFLKQAVEKAPEVNVFNYHLGMAYKMSGDKDQAKIHLKKSLVGDKEFKEKSLAEATLKEL